MTLDRRHFLAASSLSLLTAFGSRAFAQAGAPAATPGLQGKVFVNERPGGVKIHTYVAPPQGALVTSHVIELPRELVIVDGQFQPGPAKELRGYVEALNKPVNRLLISHFHPDHWFGIAHLGKVPVMASAATTGFLRQNGAGLIAERKADSAVPEIAGTIQPGTETIGGVEFRFRPVMNTEAPEIMVVDLPAQGVTVVQDIVYNRVHAVVSKTLDQWATALKEIQAAGSAAPLVLAGHGEPMQATDLAGFARYLETVKPFMAQAMGKDPKPVVEEMTKAFPDYRAPMLLELGLSRALKA